MDFSHWSFALIAVIVFVAFVVFMFVKNKPVVSSDYVNGYIKLDNNKHLKDVIIDNSQGVIALLADWCGHCKKLKKSKELEKLSEKVIVIDVPEKHKDARMIMQSVKSKGFPTLVLFNKNGNSLDMSLYEGSRTADEILKAL